MLGSIIVGLAMSIVSLVPLNSGDELFESIFGNNSGGSGIFQPAPEEPWVWPTEPLPEADPKNPSRPHLPPGHPGPVKKPAKQPEKVCIGDTGICI